MTGKRQYGGVAFATIVIVALAVFAWTREGQRRRDLTDRAEALRIELDRAVERDVQPHPPLLGDATEGEATLHYRRAAKLWVDAQAMTGPAEELLARTSDDAAWPEIDAVLAGGAAALDELKAACSAATLDVGALWRSASTTGIESVIISHSHWCGLCLVVRRHLCANDHTAAIEWTARLLTWCRDVEFGVPAYVLIANAAVTNLTDAWSDDVLRTLDAASLDRLVTVLQRFEDTAAPLDRCARAALLGSFEALHTHCDAIPERTRTTEALVGLADRIRASGPGWTSRTAALEVTDPLPGTEVGHIERQARESRARLRLLRMAVAHHRGERSVLDDPLGDGPFAVDERDGAITFRCATTSADGSPIERTARRR